MVTYKKRLAGAVVLLVCVWQLTAADAQDVRWTNTAGGLLSEAKNWDTNSVPNGSENAVFGIANTYAVRVDRDLTVGSFQQTRGDITLFGGNELTAELVSNFNSSLRITDGTVLSGKQNLLLGSEIGASGRVLVEQNAQFNGANMFLGTTPDGKNDAGFGGLAINSGAQVHVGDNRSTLAYQGGQLIVSDSGDNGKLIIRNGSKVENGETTIIGLDAGSQGSVQIDGGSSTLQSLADLTVARHGQGGLSIRNGGLAENVNGIIGSHGGSSGSAIISHAGSHWNNLGELTVANRGNGLLRVEAGARVSSGDSYLARVQGSQANAIVTGADSKWVTENLFVGAFDANTDGGTADFNILDSGFVRVGNDTTARGTNTLVISDTGTAGSLVARGRSTITNEGDSVAGLAANAVGEILVDGEKAIFTTTGDLLIGSSGIGKLNIRNAGSVFNTNGVVGQQANSRGEVTVEGALGEWKSSGELIVGQAGAGNLSVRNDGEVSSEIARMGTVSGGSGTASIRDGGRLKTNQLQLGTADGISDDGHGQLSIQTGGIVQVGSDVTTATGSQLIVSDVGTNTELVVRNGSTIDGDALTVLGLRTNSNGTARILGNGSQLNTTSNLIVGNSGTGSLVVEQGGTVTSNDGLIGQNLSGNGLATVKGSGSTWANSNLLVVGGQGQGTLNVQDGGVVSASGSIVGQQASSAASVHVGGTGSQFDSGSALAVGNMSNGFLEITDGGEVTATTALFGLNTNVSGLATINGNGSQLNTNSLLLGSMVNQTDGGIGNISVTGGGKVHVGDDRAVGGSFTGLIVGDSSGNSNLVVRNNSRFDVGTGNSYLGYESGSTGNATITGSGSWLSTKRLTVGQAGTANFDIAQSGLATSEIVTVGSLTGSQGNVSVIGSGSQLDTLQLTIGGGGVGEVAINDGGLISTQGTTIGSNSNSTGTLRISASNSLLRNTGNLIVGDAGNGSLLMETGGGVDLLLGSGTDADLIIGDQASGAGTIDVSSGSGLIINQTSFIGKHGTGTINVLSQGSFTSNEAYLGSEASGIGTINVETSGFFRLHNDLFMGTNDGMNDRGIGRLSIANSSQFVIGKTDLGSLGGLSAIAGNGAEAARVYVRNGSVFETAVSVGIGLNGHGEVHVSGAGSSWIGGGTMLLSSGINSTGTWTIREGGTAINDWVDVGDYGLLDVSGQGSQWTSETLSINGTASKLLVADGALATTQNLGLADASNSSGSIEIRDAGSQLDVTSDFRIGTSTSTGSISINGGNVSSQNSYLKNALVNIVGPDSSWSTTTNLDIGGSGDSRVFIDDSQVDVGNLTTINSGSVIVLRGDSQFSSLGGTTNNGLIQNIGGTADIFGVVDNIANVSTLADATTIFHDQVTNLGDILTAAGGQTLINADWSGPGAFLGAGTVMFDGEMNPGMSPGLIDFEGDLILGLNSSLNIELAGLNMNEFDRLLVDGDLFLNGGLSVELIDGFALGVDQSFLIADVGGSLFGQFQGLNEGDLIGGYGNQNLFISYAMGDGNDIGVFTGVPEPGSTLLVAFAGIAFVIRRRR